jgi:C1A family cysteine protease
MTAPARGLGYKPDPPKLPGQTPDRDARAKLRAAPIPYRASNRHLVLSVLDQGGLGSCVANAVMQAVRASQLKHGAGDPELGSRLWTYYLARASHNEQNEDNGTFIRAAFGALVALGFPPESSWPYSDDSKRFRMPPPPGVMREAYDQRAPTEYHRIFETRAARGDAVKMALSQGYLVCFGGPVSVAFCEGDLGREPVRPPINEPIAGGHAQAIVGYDGDVFDVVNSWGESFGEGGYWDMSREYLEWGEVNDLWVCASAPSFSTEAA